jgi:hypothetical protein
MIADAGTRPPIRVLLRTHTDWSRMGRAEFRAQDDPTLPLKFIMSREAERAIDLWDDVFDLDFFTYRAEIRDIAYSSVEQAGANVISLGFEDFASVGGFDQWWRAADEEIIVAFDDDDLLTGDLQRLVTEFSDNVDVVLWPRASLGVDESGVNKWRCPMVRCILATNAALRKSFLMRHFSAASAQRMFASHREANERIADVFEIDHDNFAVAGFRALAHPCVKFAEHCYSLKNVHVGSIQFLVETMRRGSAREFLQSIKLDVPRPVPHYATPIVPQLDDLERLWSDMRPGGE